MSITITPYFNIVVRSDIHSTLYLGLNGLDIYELCCLLPYWLGGSAETTSFGERLMKLSHAIQTIREYRFETVTRDV